MKICLVAEGSYPYITGGVSSWMHQLILNMPEHEFIIVTLMPERGKNGKFEYKLPGNVIEVKEIFLDDIIETHKKSKREIKMTNEAKTQLLNLMSSSEVDWPILFDSILALKKKKLNAGDIEDAYPFYEIIQQVYSENLGHLPFSMAYWSLKSMYKILLQLLFLSYPEADLYHSASTGYAGIIASIAAYTHDKRFVLTEHGIYTREREEDIIKSDWVKDDLKKSWIAYFYQISNCAYLSADKVISLFEANKRIQVEIGCPEEKIEVIPNGVKPDLFQEVAKAVLSRGDKNQINVGAIVRVVPIKDLFTMLDAFRISNSVLKGKKDVKFYIIGPTEEDQDYFQKCLDYKELLGLDNVEFTGKVEIKEFLKDMDMLVLTSISEGQPLVILEGMACHLPFVITNVGDYESLILGKFDGFGPAGIVSRVMDPKQIADGIVELCLDYNLRRQYGESGYQRVNKNYQYQAVVGRYKEIYKTCGG